MQKRKHETGNYEDYVKALPELYRVLKDKGWLLVYFPSSKLDRFLADTSKFFEYRDRFIVEFQSTTTKAVFGDKKTLCLVAFSKGKAKIRERIYTDILPGFESPFITTLHPRTSLWKPTFVTALIMKKFLKEDNPIILDPFAGFGSILLVAEKLGYRWVGIEVNKTTAEIAKKVIVENVPVTLAKKEVLQKEKDS